MTDEPDPAPPDPAPQRDVTADDWWRRYPAPAESTPDDEQPRGDTEYLPIMDL